MSWARTKGAYPRTEGPARVSVRPDSGPMPEITGAVFARKADSLEGIGCGVGFQLAGLTCPVIVEWSGP
jgi:hypothetical protein